MALGAAYGDRDEPGSNAFGSFEPYEGVGGEQECLLHDVVELCVVAHEPVDDAGHVAGVALVQRGERGLVGAACALDERCVAEPFCDGAEHVLTSMSPDRPGIGSSLFSRAETARPGALEGVNRAWALPSLAWFSF